MRKTLIGLLILPLLINCRKDQSLYDSETKYDVITFVQPNDVIALKPRIPYEFSTYYEFGLTALKLELYHSDESIGLYWEEHFSWPASIKEYYFRDSTDLMYPLDYSGINFMKITTINGQGDTAEHIKQFRVVDIEAPEIFFGLFEKDNAMPGVLSPISQFSHMRDNGRLIYGKAELWKADASGEIPVELLDTEPVDFSPPLRKLDHTFSLSAIWESGSNYLIIVDVRDKGGNTFENRKKFKM